MLSIEFGVAKVNKYASRESGDTLEVVERPGGIGGFSAVLADGQGSGRAAKNLSNLVTSKAITLLKDGVRDGVVARATSDYLLAYRYGQVSATLNIISADFVTRTLVLTRNNPVPSIVLHLPTASDDSFQVENNGLNLQILDEPSVPIGLYPRTRPIIHEFPLEAGLIAISFTDGIFNAGERYGEKLDIAEALHHLLDGKDSMTAQTIADNILSLAQSRDKQRPSDDMGVLVVTVSHSDVKDDLPSPRKLSLSATLP